MARSLCAGGAVVAGSWAWSEMGHSNLEADSDWAALMVEGGICLAWPHPPPRWQDQNRGWGEPKTRPGHPRLYPQSRAERGRKWGEEGERRGEGCSRVVEERWKTHHHLPGAHLSHPTPPAGHALPANHHLRRERREEVVDQRGLEIWNGVSVTVLKLIIFLQQHVPNWFIPFFFSKHHINLSELLL